MHSKDYYSDFVEQALRNLEYPAAPAGLYEPIAYTLARGGKRIRPVLLLAAAEAFGAEAEEAVNQAVGLEMFHNFTLLHDDLMDNADLRRGSPTVHVKWNPSTAVLSGDTMLTLATVLMSKCEPGIVPAVLNFFNRTAIEIYEGQQYDMDFEQRDDVTTEEYLEMIRLKTSVLLGAGCYIGALIGLSRNGGLNVEGLRRAEALRDYGILMGLAFQLRDDYLDTFGDPLTFGKEIGGDIMNDKKTWLLTYALASGKGEEVRSMLQDRELAGDSVRKVSAFRKVYEELDIPAKCNSAINGYLGRAIEKLSEAGISGEAVEFFRELALSTAGRSN